MLLECSSRSHDPQFCRNAIPCTTCSDRERSVPDLSSCPPENKVKMSNVHSHHCYSPSCSVDRDGTCTKHISLVKTVYEYHYQPSAVIWDGVCDEAAVISQVTRRTRRITYCTWWLTALYCKFCATSSYASRVCHTRPTMDYAECVKEISGGGAILKL